MTTQPEETFEDVLEQVNDLADHVVVFDTWIESRNKYRPSRGDQGRKGWKHGFAFRNSFGKLVIYIVKESFEI